MKRIFERIAEAKGGDKKVILESLAHYKGLSKVLEYAYNPFKRYYMTAPVTEGVIGGHHIDDNSFYILDMLHNREITGNKALEVVCDHISTLDPDSAPVFKGIINKDLRLGIGIKTINQAIPGLIPGSKDGFTEKPSIMLCKTFDPDKAKYPLVVAIKKDGVRARSPHYELYTRANHRFIGFDHIEDELEKYSFEKDGEMMVPGIDFDGASGLIRNHQSVPNAVYWIFDTPNIDGTKWERYQFLKDNIKETDSIKIVPHYWIQNKSQLMDLYQGVLEEREEGLVVYTNDHKYRDTRSWDWTRLVPKKKADCKVIGFEEGKGKFKNSLGKIIVDFNGHKVKVGTGFIEKLWCELTPSQMQKQIDKGHNERTYNNTVRWFIWHYQRYFLGEIAECEYKEKTKKGSMRQPRFKGWRFDKTEVNYE